MDHGVLPACTFELKEELQINDLFLGVLGSLVYGGSMIGSLISGVLYSKYQCKKIILIAFIVTIIGLLSFPLGRQYKIILGLS